MVRENNLKILQTSKHAKNAHTQTDITMLAREMFQFLILNLHKLNSNTSRIYT